MAAVFPYPRDKGKRIRRYCIEFTNEFGKRQRQVGFTDKRLTEELAAKLENEARQKSLGLVDPIQEALRDHRLAPIELHLKDYETHLSGGSRTVKHKKLTMSRVRKVVADAKVKGLGDLQIDRTDGYLHSLHEDG